ncbi:hypothetical protein Sste5346_009549 [Sporothrix stenoceras]|uniref:Major facilitator superfamily (MFS) profile domain-containing protein n=1 Tax=Sporothrix stenoceras TaxID=5173 RepID=A0ABR3YKM6_9PEZI
MPLLKHHRAWLFCGFAALGAWLYGYDGVYFTGVEALDVFIHSFGTKQADGSYAIGAASLSAMTSMINVGELVGSLSSAPINDYFGRKGGWTVGALFVCLGVILQLVASTQKSFIMGGRVVLGFGVGDVAPASIRSPLLMFWQLTLSVSQIVAAGINQGVSDGTTSFAWRFPTGFQLVFPAFVGCIIWFIPESPRWLVRKQRLDRADKALRKIHGDSGGGDGNEPYDPTADIQVIQKGIEKESAVPEGSWMSLVRDPIERRKVMYSAGALIAQQINGIQWFYYFGTVFSKAIGLTEPFLMTLIVFIIQLFVVLAALLLSNRIPRRPLMLTCTSIMMLSIFVVGCMGINSDSNYVPQVNGKVIISFVIIEIVAANFSWGPLGWCIASEMAVGPNRNKIYAIAVACFWISIWITVFTLPYLYYTANLGPKTGFVYTGLCCISLSYVYFCVGEVTGRSMEEIEGFFQNKIPVREWSKQPRLNGDTSTFNRTADSTKTEKGVLHTVVMHEV